MASQAALVQRVKNKFFSLDPQSRPLIQKLNGSINTTVTSVIVDDATRISVADVIEFDDGELCYVESKSSNTLTVYRGYLSETPGTGSSHGDNVLININPRPQHVQIVNALNETMRDLSSQGLYFIKADTDITLAAGQDEYELAATDVYQPVGVLALFYQEPVTGAIEAVPFQNIFDAGTGVHTTSGFAVRIIDWGRQASGDTLEVLYAAEINALADSDNEPLLEDVLVLGATARVMMSLEGPRIHDPGRFTDRTVQPGQALRDGGFYQAQYQRQAWRYKAYLRNKERNLPGQRFRRARRFVRR